MAEPHTVRRSTYAGLFLVSLATLMYETLLSIRRAGADIILTYGAKEFASYWRKMMGM